MLYYLKWHELARLPLTKQMRRNLPPTFSDQSSRWISYVRVLMKQNHQANKLSNSLFLKRQTEKVSEKRLNGKINNVLCYKVRWRMLYWEHRWTEIIYSANLSFRWLLGDVLVFYQMLTSTAARFSIVVGLNWRLITATLNNMQTLKLKAQLTNAFSATVNQMLGGSSQLPASSEHCFVVWTVLNDLITARSAGEAAKSRRKFDWR